MKDYAKFEFSDDFDLPPQKPKKSSGKKSFWMVWAASLILILAALMCARFFYEHHRAQAAAHVQAQAKAALVKPAKPKAPVFEFYSELPKTQAPVTTTTDSSTAKQFQYLLQVASYRNKKAAQAMQARLLLSGQSPTLTQSSSGWYRVNLGPFESKRKTDVIRHHLQKLGINGSMTRAIPLAANTSN